ncbi:MAG TPA: substrate-binding domain-containing protein [Candidatus Binatia bacterium]|nr:substrate-binding domain-containing protein [Candidatus Binatia bacterium]
MSHPSHVARHRRWRLAVLVTAAAFLLSACGAAASPTPGASQEPGTSPAPTSGQFCKGMKIVFFPGGTPGGGFETVVYNGARAAEAALGPTVTYQWSDWDPQKMITQFQEALATKPDGIAIMGHPGDDAFEPLVDQAMSEGVLVTSSNTQLQRIQAKYQSAGFGYVGAVLYDAGYSLATEAIKRGNLKSGDRAFVWGLLSQPGRGQRTQGIVDALKEAGLTVDYLEIDDATNADPSAGVPAFTGYASANPDLKAAFFDHGNVTSTIPTYMDAAGLKPGSIYTAGFDLSPATVKGVRDGYINLVIDQQQWLQGFMSILQLCLTHFYGFSGLMIDTGGGFVDKSNIDVIAPLVEQQIR